MNDLRTFRLSSGAHKPDDGQQCVMEAETRFWGLNFTDSHPCISKVIGTFCRAWNDALPTDADRERLLGRFIGRLAGTASTPAIELRRSWMCLDWLVRECAAEFLSLTPELKKHSDLLKMLPEINAGNFDVAIPIITAARAAAEAAARAAARDAARDAARAAAGAAARAAARDAARAAARDAAEAAARDAARDAAEAAARAAARDAAEAAARAAARDAAGDAARDAAGDALSPSVSRLQDSAAKLIDRMICLTEPSEAECVVRRACTVEA